MQMLWPDPSTKSSFRWTAQETCTIRSAELVGHSIEFATASLLFDSTLQLLLSARERRGRRRTSGTCVQPSPQLERRASTRFRFWPLISHRQHSIENSFGRYLDRNRSGFHATRSIFCKKRSNRSCCDTVQTSPPAS